MLLMVALLGLHKRKRLLAKGAAACLNWGEAGLLQERHWRRFSKVAADSVRLRKAAFIWRD